MLSKKIKNVLGVGLLALLGCSNKAEINQYREIARDYLIKYAEQQDRWAYVGFGSGGDTCNYYPAREGRLKDVSISVERNDKFIAYYFLDFYNRECWNIYNSGLNEVCQADRAPHEHQREFEDMKKEIKNLCNNRPVNSFVVEKIFYKRNGEWFRGAVESSNGALVSHARALKAK